MDDNPLETAAENMILSMQKGGSLKPPTITKLNLASPLGSPRGASRKNSEMSSVFELQGAEKTPKEDDEPRTIFNRTTGKGGSIKDKVAKEKKNAPPGRHITQLEKFEFENNLRVIVGELSLPIYNLKSD